MRRNLSNQSRVVRPRQQIGPALRDLRVRRDWSIAELALRARVSGSYLSRLERGVSVPSYIVLARLAAALGVSIDYFISVERTSHEFESELERYLDALAIPRSTWGEFSLLGLEARGALIDGLRRLTAPASRAALPEHAVEVAVLTEGVAGSLDLLTGGVRRFGLRPEDFLRAYVQLEELQGERLILSERMSTFPTIPGVDLRQVYRLVYAAEIADPLLLKWWNRAATSAITQTLRESGSRVIYSLPWLERYLTSGYWGPRLRLEREAVRRQFATVIDLLRREPGYRIGLLDAAPDLNFMVKGESSSLVFQFPSPPGDGGSDGEADDGVALRFNGAPFAGRFREYFDAVWNSIPEERRDREAVAALLEERLAATDPSL